MVKKKKSRFFILFVTFIESILIGVLMALLVYVDLWDIKIEIPWNKKSPLLVETDPFLNIARDTAPFKDQVFPGLVIFAGIVKEVIPSQKIIVIEMANTHSFDKIRTVNLFYYNETAVATAIIFKKDEIIYNISKNLPSTIHNIQVGDVVYATANIERNRYKANFILHGQALL